MSDSETSTTALDLETVLSFRYHSSPGFNADGTRLGAIRENQMGSDFGYVGACDSTESDSIPDFELLTNSGEVEQFRWDPTDPDRVVILEQGGLVGIDLEHGTSQVINDSSEPIENFDCHPNQRQLTFIRNRSLWVQDLDRGTCSEAVIEDRETEIAKLHEATPISLDPTGRYLATVIEPRRDVLRIAVFDTDQDEWIWRSGSIADKATLHTTVTWVEGSHLLVGVDSVRGKQREYWSVVLDTSNPRPERIAIDTVEQGILLPHDPRSNYNGLLALVSPVTGYHHIYVINVEKRRKSDLSSRELRMKGPGIWQVTDGSFEARGDADDRPAWSHDGSTLAYVTNEESAGSRLIELARVTEDGSVIETRTLETIRGNSVEPVWSPTGTIAVVRATQDCPPTLTLIDPAEEQATPVTNALPNASKLSGLAEPEAVTIETQETRANGYLYSLDRDEQRAQPSIVFCHGGPLRQMRAGFHPRLGYTLFHAMNQLLVQRGYTVLELNFSGSIGYGQSVQQAIHLDIGGPEFTECEAAANYLRERSWTSSRVGVWGISYGGFLANLLASRSDEYDAAVNLAGIWDWEAMMSYSCGRGPGYLGPTLSTWFFNLFGGRPDDPDEAVRARYRTGSPREYSNEVNCPLFASHGLDDETVPVEQTYELIRDCVAENAEHEHRLYPDEGHRFEAAQTWRDVFPRIAEFFDRNLT